MDTIGSRIKKARKAAGLKQYELAHRLGMTSQSGVSNWERDITEPLRHNVLALAEVLSVHPAWIEYGIAVPETDTGKVESERNEQ